MSVEEKLKQMGLELPSAPAPVAAYIPAVSIDGWVYTSGQLPFVAGELKYQGKLGSEITVEQGYEAAKICVLNCLAAIKSVIGDLNQVKRVVKVTGFVNSAPGFNEQPKVINGASELLGQVFDEAGRHARSAVGVNELPLGSPVEVEMIVRLK